MYKGVKLIKDLLEGYTRDIKCKHISFKSQKVFNHKKPSYKEHISENSARILN